MNKIMKNVLFGTITFVIGFVSGFFLADYFPKFMEDPDFSDIKEREGF